MIQCGGPCLLVPMPMPRCRVIRIVLTPSAHLSDSGSVAMPESSYSHRAVETYQVPAENITLSIYSANAPDVTKAGRRLLAASDLSGTTIIEAKIETIMPVPSEDTVKYELNTAFDYAVAVVSDTYPPTVGTNPTSTWIIVICVGASLLVIFGGIVMCVRHRSLENQDNGHETHMDPEKVTQIVTYKSNHSDCDVMFENNAFNSTQHNFAPYYNTPLIYQAQ